MLHHKNGLKIGQRAISFATKLLLADLGSRKERLSKQNSLHKFQFHSNRCFIKFKYPILMRIYIEFSFHFAFIIRLFLQE